MSDSESDELTDFGRYFLRPGNPTHRQYEALRAYFVEALPSHEVARRFGYSPGSFRVLCHQFRAQPDRAFFLPPAKGPKSAPKTDPVRDQVIALASRTCRSTTSVVSWRGADARSAPPPSRRCSRPRASPPPRRRDDERPEHPHPEAAAPADVRAWICAGAACVPASAVCSYSCPGWPASRCPRCCSRRTSPARARCRRPAPCAPCSH